MTLELGATLYVTAALLVPGNLGLRAAGLSPRMDRIAWLGWCAAAGALLNGALFFAWSWVAPGTLGPWPVAGAQLALVVALGLAVRRRARAGLAAAAPQPPSPKGSTTERAGAGLLVGLVLLLALARVALAAASPALTGDEAMLWGFKAQVLHHTGGLGRDFVAAMADPALRHEDYPLLNPLLRAWVHGLSGEVAFIAQRLPIQLLTLGLHLALLGALWRRARPLVAALLFTAWAASPFTANALATADADAQVALGLVLAADGLARALGDGRGASPDPRGWVLAAVGAAVALFSKNDAVLHLAALGLAWLLVRAPWRRPRPARARGAAWLLLPLAVLVAGKAYNAWAGFENDLVTGKGTGVGFFGRLLDQGAEYAGPVAAWFRDELLFQRAFDGFLFLGVGLALLGLGARRLAGPRPGDRTAAAEALAALGALVGLALVYLSTPQPLDWHLASSAHRVAWQALPLAALGLAGAARRRSARPRARRDDA